MRYVVACVIAIIGALYIAQPVSAHVLITDDTHTAGAVLHIIPDDDPVAGEVATIFFDLQDAKADPTNGSVLLRVKTEGKMDEVIPMQIDTSLATAKYTFPTQGQYRLVITTKSSSGQYTFAHTQRVSRGALRTGLEVPRYQWAEITLLGCGITFSVGCIVMWNRRSSIRRNSTH